MVLPLAIWASIGILAALVVRRMAFSHQVIAAPAAWLLGLSGALAGGPVGNTLRGGEPLALHTASIVGAAIGATLVLVAASVARRRPALGA